MKNSSAILAIGHALLARGENKYVCYPFKANVSVSHIYVHIYGLSQIRAGK